MSTTTNPNLTIGFLPAGPDADQAPLYCQYPGELEPQPAFIEIDCERRTMQAGWSADATIPAAVWHGHAHRVSIPSDLTPAAINQILTELAPTAASLCSAYASEWDGSNFVGAYATLDRQEVLSDAQGVADDLADDAERASIYTDPAQEGAEEYRDAVTATTTDDELVAMAAEALEGITASAESEGRPFSFTYGVAVVAEYLTERRDELASEALFDGLFDDDGE